MPTVCPSLVTLCQKVAINNIDLFDGFGGNLSFDILEPILANCSAEQLDRLEKATPHLEENTQELWKSICLRSHPIVADKFERGEIEEPKSWRDHYFHLGEVKQARLEALTAHMRSQRQKADEQRREIKLTDRIPPPKRTRFNDYPSQPRTLFQKTRSEVSRLQRNVYSAPKRLPSMANGKQVRVLPSRPTPVMQNSSNIKTSSVTVNVVTVKKSPVLSTKSAPVGVVPAVKSPPQPVATSPLPPPIIAGPQYKASKKDPSASLFMPKHRAYSQRPQ